MFDTVLLHTSTLLLEHVLDGNFPIHDSVNR